MMRFAAPLALLALAGCSTDPRGEMEWLRPVANPSQVIATELAFARMAGEEGTWTAFRHYSTGDALMPSPDWVNVHETLEDVPDPAEPIVWAPESVWSSCDGSYAVTTGGAHYPDGRRTRFVTVWQRQNDGEYRWVLDQGFADPNAQLDPEIVSAKVADCPDRRMPAQRARRGEAWHSGRSDDGTLVWDTAMAPDCSRTVIIRLSQEGAMREVFRRESAAPAASSGPAPLACGAS